MNLGSLQCFFLREFERMSGASSVLFLWKYLNESRGFLVFFLLEEFKRISGVRGVF